MTDLQTPTGGEFRDTTPPGPTNSGGAPARAPWWIRLVDGGYVWGESLVSPTRHGVTHYRLIVFPPGIDTSERRLLRLWRGWPTWGAVAWVVAHIILSSVLPHGTALAISATLYLGTGVVLFTRVSELRTRVRTLTAVHIAGHVDAHAASVLAEWRALTTELRMADARRDEGRCSPAEHELTWWSVYDRLDHVRLDPENR